VIDTVTASVKAYADLDFTILQLRTARVSLKLAQDFMDENKIKVRVGTLAPIEITQAEAQVADREESVIIFEAALRTAEDAVRTSIGMRKDSPDWERPVRPADPLTLKEYSPTEEGRHATAVSNRPDLQQARLNIETPGRRSARASRCGARPERRLRQPGVAPTATPTRSTICRAEARTLRNAGLLLACRSGNRLALSELQPRGPTQAVTSSWSR
jgi:hypothetical protein